MPVRGGRILMKGERGDLRGKIGLLGVLVRWRGVGRNDLVVLDWKWTQGVWSLLMRDVRTGYVMGMDVVRLVRMLRLPYFEL